MKNMSRQGYRLRNVFTVISVETKSVAQPGVFKDFMKVFEAIPVRIMNLQASLRSRSHEWF